MKIKMIFFLLLIMAAGLVQAGSLADLYKKGTVELKADAGFAAGCDWNELFADWNALSAGDNPIGKLHNLAVAPDGSVYVSNYAGFSFYRFNPDGSFALRFGEEGRRTSTRSVYNHRPALGSVQENQLLTFEYQGRLVLYSLEGRETKRLTCDYPILDVEAAGHGKLAVTGTVILKGGDAKHLIALKEIDSGKESILDARVETNSMMGFVPILLPNHYMISVGSTVAPLLAFCRRTPEGHLVTGFSNSPEINVFDARGQLLRQFRLSQPAAAITAAEREKFRNDVATRLEEVIRKYKVADAEATKVRQALERCMKDFPASRSFFNDLLVDAQGNILVFPDNSATGAGLDFQAYSSSGQFLGAGRLLTPGYTLTVGGRSKRLAFHGNYLYALAEANEGGKVPARLVRFQL